MPCYHPLRMYRTNNRGPSGKYLYTFDARRGFVDQYVDVPCGKCIGCRLERSRQWAVRGIHELKYHDNACFITLTYNDENLPENGTLVPEHLTLFWKRLRKEIAPIKIKYIACGEYGDNLGRPHYHAIIYGYDFPDREPLRLTQSGFQSYESAQLSRLWPYGFSNIGGVTFESIAYVARYCLKKVNGDGALEHYGSFVDDSGAVCFTKYPEFARYSRGIGENWCKDFADDILRSGNRVLVNDHLVGIPRYYKKKIDELSDLDQRRLHKNSLRARKIMTVAQERDPRPLPDVLATAEEIKHIQLQRLPRPLDETLQNSSYVEFIKEQK